MLLAEILVTSRVQSHALLAKLRLCWPKSSQRAIATYLALEQRVPEVSHEMKEKFDVQLHPSKSYIQ